ncbi:TPA: LOW QUALITY PROTEIN: hypothetical protein N0F65_004188, partial [Lagenidium giganteum]
QGTLKTGGRSWPWPAAREPPLRRLRDATTVSTMENNEAGKQRVIIYTTAAKKKISQRNYRGEYALAVPTWFDLPLLLPEVDAVAQKLRGNNNNAAADDKATGDVSPSSVLDERAGSMAVSKVSRLSNSPSKEVAWMEQRKDAIMQRHRKVFAYSQQHLMKKRKPSQSGARITLERLDGRSKLREKLWQDLNRFGLWPLPDGSGDDEEHETLASIDQAVDSIMKQWEASSDGKRSSIVTTQFDDAQSDITDISTSLEHLTPLEPVTKQERKNSSVFLTSLPSSTSDFGSESTFSYGNQSSTMSRIGALEDGPEDEAYEDDAADEEETYVKRKEIVAPGLKRRGRLRELHSFVEKQLQKRLVKSWDTIEIALNGSGDLSVNQIVKFLQNSDVRLGATDAAKVQSVLDRTKKQKKRKKLPPLLSKLDNTSASTNIAPTPETETASAPPPLKTKSTGLSYETFKKIFFPADKADASKWKREADREKARHRQEKEIYARELAALEEKVKKRLAESAKQMVDILSQFKCDPLAIPWENDEHRKLLRSAFFDIIFSKVERRRRSLVNAFEPGLTSNSATNATSTAISIIPAKLTTKVVRSALLQKYSRNGHFETIEVSTAAYLFHDFAADCVKTSIRAYWKKREADEWPERQMIFRFRLKKSVFLEWRRFTRHADVLRKFVMRKFVAWAYHTRKMYQYYAFFRVCFWPFYVWKRHLQQQIIARGKTSFLVNVLETYVQLRHFNAWKARYRQNLWYRKHVLRLRKKKNVKTCRIVFHDWRARMETNIIVHRLWKRRGHVLHRVHKLYMVKVTFIVWRYYAILKMDMRRRQSKCILSAAVSKNKRLIAVACSAESPKRLMSQRGIVLPPQLQPRGSISLSRKNSIPAASEPTEDADTAAPDDQSDDEESVLDTLNGAAAATTSASASTTNAPALTRIMETEVGASIKRKTRLYYVCLQLYLSYREQDRREMIGNLVLFRRVGRYLLRNLAQHATRKRKSRFATELGAFRVLHARFRQWMIGALYKMPAPTDELGFKIEDEYEPRKQSLLEEKLDKVELSWKFDNEWRREGIEKVPIEAAQLRQDLVVVGENDMHRKEAFEELEQVLKKKRFQEETFLKKEAAMTMKARASVIQHAQYLLKTRAQILHDAMDHVYTDLIRQHTCQLLKSSFRSIRMMIMLKCTGLLCHRAQIRNWLRLCKRFRFWDKNIDHFYSLKVKFKVFQAIVRNVVSKWKYQSPGLSVHLQRQQQLINFYEGYLERHDLLDGTASSASLAMTKHSPANNFHGVFLRWVQYTQLARVSHQIIELCRRKRELWLAASVFHALRTHTKTRYTFEQRRQHVPFLWQQCVADLDAYHTKMIAFKMRLPSVKLKKELHAKTKRLRKTVAGTPTLKQLFQEHEQEVRERLYLENRLMFVAYNERKAHHYSERFSPLHGAPVGREFAYEPAPPFGSISEIAVLCGKKLDGISLVVKTNAAMTYPGPLHGNPFGNRESFVLARGELLILIEGYASQTIYALRFGTSTGRLSKWYGQSEKGTRFELRSEYGSKREEIVGIYGFADATSLHALGCVYRHTTLRNVFEGLWLQSDQPQATSSAGNKPSDEIAICDRQFAYFLQARTCDVLAAMKRSHKMALRAHRMDFLAVELTRTRVLMGLTRWFFNSLVHGLVQNSGREEEGKRILQDGINKRAAGEKLLHEGTRMLEEVDSFRDEDQQLNIATLGVKKVTELREMIEHGEKKIAQGKRWIEEGQEETLRGRSILPHIPMTKRMITAIRSLYKVVQTKDYIDQMDQDVRAILLEGDADKGGHDSIFQ